MRGGLRMPAEDSIIFEEKGGKEGSVALGGRKSMLRIGENSHREARLVPALYQTIAEMLALGGRGRKGLRCFGIRGCRCWGPTEMPFLPASRRPGGLALGRGNAEIAPAGRIGQGIKTMLSSHLTSEKIGRWGSRTTI